MGRKPKSQVESGGVFFQDQVFLDKELDLPLFAFLAHVKTQYNS
jgi:hypothetical protein